MIQEFTLDLRAARRNSGLRQVDVAHLMDVHKTKISNLERGHQRPSVKDICTLSMIYGRSFETLFAGIFSEVRAELSGRLVGLSEPEPNYKRRFNRSNTLSSLEDRLKDDPINDYDDFA